MAKRLAGNPGIAQDERRAYAGGPFVLNQKKLEAPLHWRKPARIGVQFMGDWMHLGVKYKWINAILDVIGNCPQHTFFTLTKRPERIVQQVLCAPEYYDPKQRDIPFPYFKNLWLGVTVCNQEEADTKIPELLKIPGFKKWVSVEPCLSEINFKKDLLCGVSWCIIGAESGPSKKRPFNPDWARRIIKQCKAQEIPVFYKQDSKGKLPLLDGIQYVEFPLIIGRQN
jgi:protein gp37